MEYIGLILVILGIVVSLIFGIQLLIVAFRTSVLWGLGCLLLPFVSFLFVALNWEIARKPFLRGLAGSLLVLIGILVPGHR